MLAGLRKLRHRNPRRSSMDDLTFGLLFDSGWYLQVHSDVASAGLDPLAHYLGTGWKEGRDPSPYLDTDWYLRTYPEVAELVVDPLTDYVTLGWKHGRDPSPHFDSDWYLAEYPEVAASGRNPLLDYITSGWQAGRDPSPHFSSSWYLEQYTDVRAVGTNPLRHYLTAGYFEDRLPSPFHRDIPDLAPWPTSLWDESSRDARLQEPRVAVIVPARDKSPYTQRCLDALWRSRVHLLADVFVVDDGSEPPLSEVLRLPPFTSILKNDTNLGYLMSCNRSVESLLHYPFVLLLNNDTEPLPGFLEELLALLDRSPSVAVAGSCLIDPTGRIQESGGVVWRDGSGTNVERGTLLKESFLTFPRAVDYASAASLLIRSDFIKEHGLYDEVYAPAYYEDTDLAMRVRSLHQEVWLVPPSVVIHHEGKSHGRDLDDPTSVKHHQVINSHHFESKWRKELSGHWPRQDSKVPEAAMRLTPARETLVWIDNSVPRPLEDSGSVRASWLLKLIGQLDIQVIFVPTQESPFSEQARRLSAAGIPVAASVEQARWLADAVGASVKWVWVSRPESAAESMLRARMAFPDALLIYDTVDVHHLRLSRERELGMPTVSDRDIAEMRALEGTAARIADETIAVTRDDAGAISALEPRASVLVVPNIHEVGPAPAFVETRGLIFVGGFQHRPNEDAVEWFIAEVWPLVDERVRNSGLTIAGSHIPESIWAQATPEICVAGFVPNIDVLIREARISIAPLRFGAGMKGKVGQAMALGVPVVGTTTAFEGMGMTPRKHMLVADDPAEFAQALLELYNNQSLWHLISESSRDLIQERYSPQRAQVSLEALLKGPKGTHLDEVDARSWRRIL